jgi:hypothetical protein
MTWRPRSECQPVQLRLLLPPSCWRLFVPVLGFCGLVVVAGKCVSSDRARSVCLWTQAITGATAARAAAVACSTGALGWRLGVCLSALRAPGAAWLPGLPAPLWTSDPSVCPRARPRDLGGGVSPVWCCYLSVCLSVRGRAPVTWGAACSPSGRKARAAGRHGSAAAVSDGEAVSTATVPLEALVECIVQIGGVFEAQMTFRRHMSTQVAFRV